MINTQDQEALFKLISNYLNKDLSCIAIGGTAMMMYGYKNTTKDIDLVFSSENDRNTFIEAIQKLGYTKKSLGPVYTEQKKQHEGKPLLFGRGDERFDLFVRDVFGYDINKQKSNITQRHDFIGTTAELTIDILPVEELILLKAITGREKDEEDIHTILEKEKHVDWQRIVDLAITQHDCNEWILLDLESTMQQLKKKHFIKQTYFEQVYKAQEKKK